MLAKFWASCKLFGRLQTLHDASACMQRSRQNSANSTMTTGC